MPICIDKRQAILRTISYVELLVQLLVYHPIYRSAGY